MNCILPCAYGTLVCIFLHLYLFMLERTLSSQSTHYGLRLYAKVIVFIVMYICLTNSS